RRWRRVARTGRTASGGCPLLGWKLDGRGKWRQQARPSIIAAGIAALHHHAVDRSVLDSQRPVLGDRARALPRVVERGAQLARTPGSVQVGFTLDASG